MHMRPGPIEAWAIKCPDCQWGWNEDQQCQTCDGTGRVTIGQQRPFVSRRLSNLTIALTLIALAVLLSWWVVK